MPVQLLALTDGPNILVNKPILLIGRHAECDIQIESRKISRRHCCIAQINDYLVVRDLGSTNGIRINGVRALEGRLHPGDELTIGNQRYQVQWDIANPYLASANAKPVNDVHQAAVANKGVDHDAILERFDDPVPLADVKDFPKASPAVPTPSAADAGLGIDRPSSLILSEKPHLVPGSEELPPESPPSPPSPGDPAIT